QNRLDSEFGKRCKEYWELKNGNIQPQIIMGAYNQQIVLQSTAVSKFDKTEEEFEKGSIAEMIINYVM
ncbi:hypothetical protein BY458DRAFT_431615, partial [Sporodiniella umbellata]